MCDIDGLLTTTRTVGNLEGHKQHYAKDRAPIKDLAQIVKEIKPTVRLLPNTKDLYLCSNYYSRIKKSIALFQIDFNWCIGNPRTFYTRNSSRYGQVQ